MCSIEKNKKNLRNYNDLLIKNASLIQKISLHLYSNSLQPFNRLISEFTLTPCTRKYVQINDVFNVMMEDCANEIVSLCNRQIDSASRIKYADNVVKIHQIAVFACYAIRHINSIAMANNIVSQADSEYFNAFIGDKKCTENNIYVETRVLERLGKMCEEGASCTKTDSIQFCNILAELKHMKQRVEFSYLNNDTSISLLRQYGQVYNRFQERFIKLMFKNIVVLFNENLIQCMITFLDQQLQIIIQHNHRIQEIERIENFKRPVVIEWSV